MTQNLGFTTLVNSDLNSAALGLGGLTYGVNTVEMAAAYSAFANNGVYTRPRTYIEVRDNKMIVGKKYRGNYARCMAQYVNDRLEKLDDIIPERIFITHTPVTPEVLDAAKSAVASKNYFSEVVETYAGCTISCHCGEGCLGVLFIRKKK